MILRPLKAAWGKWKIVAHEIGDFQSRPMTRDAFSLRRPLDPPVGVPRDFRGGQVWDPVLVKLAHAHDIESRLEADRMPIPSTRDREGYYDDRHFEYWLSGLKDYLTVREALPTFDWREVRLLDFGGATGRVARHFVAQADVTVVTICDININNVEWVLRNLPSAVGTFKNTPLPSLPIPDRHYDIVTAFSVFTHIDEYELAWLYELRRILKPNGTLYLTVHNDDTWRILPSTYVFSTLDKSDQFRSVYATHPDLPERLVFEYSAETVYNCNTFHPNAYIHRTWGRLFSVVEILPVCHGYQSVVVLRNDRLA